MVSTNRLLYSLSLLMAVSGCQSEWGLPKNAGDTDTSSLVVGAGDQSLVIDFGTVMSGSSHEVRVKLYNPSDERLVISSFRSGCECTSVSGLPLEIAAGETSGIAIITDHSKQPDFVGGLAVIVELLQGEEVCGTIDVHCQVKATPKWGEAELESEFVVPVGDP